MLRDVRKGVLVRHTKIEIVGPLAVFVHAKVFGVGDHSKSTYCLRKFNFDTYATTEEFFDVSANIKSDHGGGDDGLVRELIAYLNGDRSSVSITKLSDSVNGHLVVYNAEISRKTGQIVRF